MDALIVTMQGQTSVDNLAPLSHSMLLPLLYPTAHWVRHDVINYIFLYNKSLCFVTGSDFSGIFSTFEQQQVAAVPGYLQGEITQLGSHLDHDHYTAL